MAITGLHDVSDFDSDERPKNWRAALALLSAVLFPAIIAPNDS